MKLLIIILTISPLFAFSQKTTRTDVASARSAYITRIITTGEQTDTVFYMFAANAKYTHIIDIIGIKYGTANEINDLLSECIKFLPEAKGSSLEYEGNVITVSGFGPIMLWGTGNDSHGYTMLGKPALTKLQSGLKQYLK